MPRKFSVDRKQLSGDDCAEVHHSLRPGKNAQIIELDRERAALPEKGAEFILKLR